MDLTNNNIKTNSILSDNITKIPVLSAEPSNNFDNNSKISSTTNIKNNDSTSIFQYIIKIIRIILVIYLVGYIILTILNQFNLLPEKIANMFSLIDIVGKFSNKNKKKNEDDTSSLATSIKNDNTPRPEKIAPSQFVPEDNSGILTSKPEPKPDKASSSTQSSKIANKAGYCYIGEDRGFRSCIKIKNGDKCMSGDIFSTEAICINPNLRP
jgi:hypothetical protein